MNASASCAPGKQCRRCRRPKPAMDADDPRAVAARAASHGRTNPEQHIHDTDGPEEDQAMLAPLTMQAYHGALPMPQDYLDWWMKADFAHVLRLSAPRAATAAIANAAPICWLLKSPVHLFRLDQFAARISGREIRLDPPRSGQGDPLGLQPAIYAVGRTLRAGVSQQGGDRPAFPRLLGARACGGHWRRARRWASTGSSMCGTTMSPPIRREPSPALYAKLGHEFTPETRNPASRTTTAATRAGRTASIAIRRRNTD